MDVTAAIIRVLEAAELRDEEPYRIVLNPVDAGRLAEQLPVRGIEDARMRLMLENVAQGYAPMRELRVLGIPLAFDGGVLVGKPRADFIVISSHVPRQRQEPATRLTGC